MDPLFILQNSAVYSSKQCCLKLFLLNLFNIKTGSTGNLKIIYVISMVDLPKNFVPKDRKHNCTAGNSKAERERETFKFQSKFGGIHTSANQKILQPTWSMNKNEDGVLNDITSLKSCF